MLFFVLIFVVALLYASVGHGGASGYLALMSVYDIPNEYAKVTALILNILVSLVSFIYYYRAGFFNFRLFAAFAVFSIPFAFVGGWINLNPIVYKRLLGIILLFPILKLLGVFSEKVTEIKPINYPLAAVLGASIGLLSGMLGIGGGIILTPLLLVLNWSNMKEAAAVSAIFIFVNSLAGLFGVLSKGVNFAADMWLTIACAFSGGLIGAYLGTHQLQQFWLKKILAFVLLIAVFKLIFT